MSATKWAVNGNVKKITLTIIEDRPFDSLIYLSQHSSRIPYHFLWTSLLLLLVALKILGKQKKKFETTQKLDEWMNLSFHILINDLWLRRKINLVINSKNQQKKCFMTSQNSRQIFLQKWLIFHVKLCELSAKIQLKHFECQSQLSCFTNYIPHN